jgi:hypothetical protein
MITVYPLGTTIYLPEKCFNGFTIFSYEVGIPTARIIDMNGNIVNEISPVRAARAKLLRNGNILTVSGMAWSSWRREGDVREYDWNGNLVWSYKPLGRAHHDVERLENGNTLLIYQERMPRKYVDNIKKTERRTTILSDVAIEVTPRKEIIWEWHGYEHLDIDWYNPLVGIDWMHTNTIRALPENRHYDSGDKRFKPRNVMISPRSLDTILIIDKESKDVVWSYKGEYNGGLQGQHDSHMVEKGLPGDGNILVFDNGSSTIPLKTLTHPGESYILEIDPITKKVVWKYENGQNFFSKFRSSVQRLPNGNTLICEADGRRIFEVTIEGNIVWEYTIPYSHRVGRAKRYPYNYCPQTKVLGKPREEPVVPTGLNTIYL